VEHARIVEAAALSASAGAAAMDVAKAANEADGFDEEEEEGVIISDRTLVDAIVEAAAALAKDAAKLSLRASSLKFNPEAPSRRLLFYHALRRQHRNPGALVPNRQLARVSMLPVLNFLLLPAGFC